MNQMAEEECFEIVETCLEHPNMEVLQIADRLSGRPDIEEEEAPVVKKGIKKAKDFGNVLSTAKLSICKGIQVRL